MSARGRVAERRAALVAQYAGDPRLGPVRKAIADAWRQRRSFDDCAAAALAAADAVDEQEARRPELGSIALRRLGR